MTEPSLPPESDPAAQDAPGPAAPVAGGSRRRRRVTTEPPPGTDPAPASEPDRHTLTENDERLKAEKPPHY